LEEMPKKTPGKESEAARKPFKKGIKEAGKVI